MTLQLNPSFASIGPLRRLPLALAALWLAGAGAAAAQSFTPGPTAPVVEQTFARLAAAPQVAKVLGDVKADDARALADLRALTEIPAPPFKETARGEHFLDVAQGQAEPKIQPHRMADHVRPKAMALER